MIGLPAARSCGCEFVFCRDVRAQGDGLAAEFDLFARAQVRKRDEDVVFRIEVKDAGCGHSRNSSPARIGILCCQEE